MLFIACLHEAHSCDMPIGPFPCTHGSHFSTLINHLSSVPMYSSFLFSLQPQLPSFYSTAYNRNGSGDENDYSEIY